MGFGSYRTAWSWLHKIREAMVRPERAPLAARVGPTRPMSAARAGQAGPWCRRQDQGRRRGRDRSRPGPRASPGSAAPGRDPRCLGPQPRGLPGRAVARPATIAIDGWSGYAGLAAEGSGREPVNLAASWGDAALRLPAIHLVFGLAKRWRLGTHHGAVTPKHLPAYLDEFELRFTRRTAKNLSHRFARVIQQAVRTRPATYHAIVAAAAS